MHICVNQSTLINTCPTFPALGGFATAYFFRRSVLASGIISVQNTRFAKVQSFMECFCSSMPSTGRVFGSHAGAKLVGGRGTLVGVQLFQIVGSCCRCR